MVQLQDSIIAVSSRISPLAWAELGIYTLADLLTYFPTSVLPPPLRVNIGELSVGSPRVVVIGVVQYNSSELLDIHDYARRVSVPCSYLSDGGEALLRLEWVELRRDPPDLSPGDHVVVAGVPWVVQQGRSRVTAAGMVDPDWAVIEALDQRPTPGVDGPEAVYVDTDRVPSFAIHGTARYAIDNLELPSTLADGARAETLIAALLATHAPTGEQEWRWGLDARQWLLAVIQTMVGQRPDMPAPRLIKSPRDAEEYACAVMTALGYAGAVVSPPGRDGGVDVRARGAVAQVKLEGVKTDAPRVQALLGIASHEQCEALFFSLAGYTQAALQWAERTNMALFEFDYSGGVSACSPRAHRLWANGVEESESR